MTSPLVRRHGVDHAALAARARRLGWWSFVEYRVRAAAPFLRTEVATAVGNPLLYLTAMGLGLGAIVDGPVDGVRYLWFVAPALLVATIATTGASWGTWPIFSGFKWEKSYLAAHAAPLGPRQIAAGETVAVALRLLAQGLIFWLLGLAFGAWPGPSALWLVPISVVAGLAMFTPLMAFAATLEDEGLQFVFVQRLVVMPMFLFAGTFFPLSSMPWYLQWIGWVSPMWHGTQLARVASYGMANPAWLTGLHVAVLLGFTATGLALAGRRFTQRLVG